MRLNHSKQRRPCIYAVRNYRFHFEIVIGEKMERHRNFVHSFFREKINRLKASKIPNLTRKIRNMVSCPLRTRTLLNKKIHG